MKCPKCGQESRIKFNDIYCRSCGFPLKAVSHDGEQSELESIYVDVNFGIMLVNGKEINNVTAFSLELKDGKYGLSVVHDDCFKASIP